VRLLQLADELDAILAAEYIAMVGQRLSRKGLVEAVPAQPVVNQTNASQNAN